MSRITRRVFLKASALLGVTLAVGRYMTAKTLSFTDLADPAHAGHGKAKKVIGVVSDVDAHSQCRMRVGVQGGRLTAIAGDPYPVKAMVVMAANPRLACANTTVVEEALEKLDFLAVADLFMTPTAELAEGKHYVQGPCDRLHRSTGGAPLPWI